MIIALQTLIFFRESLLTVIERFLRPYYKRLTFKFKDEDISDVDSEDHVYADYDDEKGVVFYPPVYAQRYAAVTDCLMDERWCGEFEKVVDFGYNDMSFIKYLKDIPGVKHILGVDLETIPLRCSSDLLGCDQYVIKRENPLQVTLFQGNAADPDYRLIGCDAVVAIEMIEHMLPHDLERIVHTIFGFIKPRIAVITTPNGDFNVLFKSLENNGLRRLDHFFEWSREQFNDWASNIVTRYPQYTVTYKGIGPGPAGTIHLGCCSQLALFVAKEYQKQPDLNLNSLALVAKQPSGVNLMNFEGWESPHTIGDNNMLCIENSVESYTQLILKQQSYMTVILTSPSFSLETMEYKDKMLQCNMDFEFGKNFLMFDEETLHSVLIPRRKRLNRVYMIEDVASRLNCTTLQVKKFSKATQNLLAKNKMDAFAHTREVVDEIRHLTKMLNFNRDYRNKELQNEHVWYNINWGENAPYWNQYYKIIREYNYPFEVKSEECRILDTISEEISRLVDSENNEFYIDSHKLEIPIEHLMEVVEHITTDTEKVKDILEWNGYEIVDDVLIYSRLAIDNVSEVHEEWQEIDNLSDWGSTVVRSSVSNCSTVELDSYGRCLHRVLDQKIHRLRSITDDSITIELDRIVCRLMKLALYATKGQLKPPPMSWLQHKLFDLLSLTEKAIERRRRLYFENFALKAIEYNKEEKYDNDIDDQEQITDTPLNHIMDKYQHVISPLDQLELQDYQDIDTWNMEFDNDSLTSVEINEQELDINNNDHDLLEKSNAIDIIYQTDETLNIGNSENPQSEKTLQNNDMKIIANYNILPETDSPISIIPQVYIDYSDEIKVIESNINSMAIEETILQGKGINRNENSNFSIKTNKYKHNKRITSKTSLRNIAKFKKGVNVEDGNKRIKTKKYIKLQSKLSKPIPDSLVNLCNMEVKEDLKENNRNVLNNTAINNVSNNEDCLFISIVTESDEETITLRRNMGTDPEVSYDVNNETVSETVINITKHDSFENVQSETIFILDINQPSTSKGVRNLNADVQCGPDLNLTCALSPVASLMKTPKLFNNGIKIDDSFDNVFTRKKTCEFGMCTENVDNYFNISRDIGIKIKDSDVNFHDKMGYQSEKSPENLIDNKNLTIETEVLKQILPKNDDSISEFCDSVGSLQKSLLGCSSINTSVSQGRNYIDNTLPKLRKTKIITRELVHGGVHVHSFKDKMVSEDVIYQGEWKRAPKVIAKKQSNEIAKTKKRMISKNKIIHTKDKTTVNNSIANKNSRFPQKSVPKFKNNVINNNVHKIFNTGNQKKKSIHKISTTVRVDKTVTRVVSKITVRTRKTKSIKSFANKKTTKYNIIAKNDVEVYKEKLKNYLPRYLRKKIHNMNIEINNAEVKTDIDNKMKNMNDKTDCQEIANNLLKVQDNVQHHVDYLVFQNGVDVEPSVDKELILSSDQTDSVLKYECSPQSQNSSTCSSPNSIATVRPIAQNRIVINHKSNKSEQSNSGLKSEYTSSKYKYQTHYKINKKPPLDLTPKAHSNKENIPQSSKNIMTKANKITKISKSIFKGKTKNVVMQNNEHVSIKSSSMKFSKRPLKKSFTPLNTRNSNEKDSNIIDCCNSKDILLKDNIHVESENLSNSTSDANDSVDELISLDNLPLNNEINNEKNNENSSQNDYTETPKQSIHDNTSSIMSVIRKLLQEKIQLTENNSKDSLISNSDTVILNKDEPDRSFNNSLSPASIKTVVTNEDSILESELEAVDTSDDINQNQSPWSYTGIKTPILELDSVSYMSVASTSNSKISDYYLADNELDTLLSQADPLLTANSVQEVIEPKEENKNSLASGFLETLSGFSMNAEILLSDNVNLTDSEIGSLALTSARLTASEELLFASGRSSDTYESCFFDDDTYVPNWLFDAMSQQQSNEESLDALDEQLGEVLDANGNLLEPGVGATSGAGDGKGIHSDNSQDSSGRGTSLSSTASSGPENEAILIDLSAVAAYAPLNAFAISTSEDTDGTDQNNMPNGRDMANRVENQNNPPRGTSSVDGDVSSICTDAIEIDSD